MTDYKALYEQSQKENATLSRVLEHKQDKIEEHLASCNFYEEQCQKLKQEINHKNQKFIEWGEENKELKDELNDWRKCAEEHCMEEPEELLDYLNNLEQDKDEYYDIIQYTETLTGSPGSAREIIDYIKELKEQNEELNETIDCHNAQFIYLAQHTGDIQDYKDFNKFLKNEYSEEESQKIYDKFIYGR